MKVRIGLGLVVTITLLTGIWLVARDSSLVRVDHVEVTGLYSSRQAPLIAAALRSEAREMTTLHVKQDALERAVSQFPSVAKIDVQRHLLNKLTIKVTEHKPVAALSIGKSRIPVTESGLILRGMPADSDLPTFHPKSSVSGNHVEDQYGRAVLGLLAGAPRALQSKIKRVSVGGADGLTLELRNGPKLIFGSARDIPVKWLAVNRVLAEPSSAGATYVDVRLPERVAVGGVVSPAEVLEQQQAGNPTPTSPQNQTTPLQNQPPTPPQQ